MKRREGTQYATGQCRRGHRTRREIDFYYFIKDGKTKRRCRECHLMAAKDYNRRVRGQYVQVP